MTLTEVVFRLRSTNHPFCTYTAKHPQVRVVVNQTGFDGASRTWRGLVNLLGTESETRELADLAKTAYDSAEPARMEAGKATIRATTSLDRLAKGGDPLAFALEYFGDGAFFAPSFYREGAINARVLVPQRVDLSSMLAAYEAGVRDQRWTDFKLIRLDDFDVEQQISGAFAENLTHKQLEVIKTAHALGFYNTPRDVTLDDLSNVFGISKAAVHNRLQAAERKVISKFFS